MRILLDECVPWAVRGLLPAHTCTSTQRHGWGGSKNGDLLRLAEGEFDMFITCDQSIRYQQNLAQRRISILVLSTNDFERLRSAAAVIQSAVDSFQPGEFRHLDVP